MMKPIFEHRTAVVLDRRRFCRNDVKRLDKLMNEDPRTKDRYTGLVGRTMYFQFETLELKREFGKAFKHIFGENGEY